jgi:glycerol kinase
VIGECTIIPGARIPIAGVAGDQQAALFGQLCTEEGMVKNTYGTGCFMLMNTGEKAITSTNQLLTTIAWQIDGKTTYALEGSVFIGGAVVQWLRDELKVINSAPDIEKLAATVKSSEGVYIVPAFAGLGAPYWNAHARGALFGLTRGTNHAHIARAALDSIAYQSADLLKCMQADSHIPIRELRVDGGATANDLLMQFQADLLDCNVVRPIIIETTAMGAAFLAGLGVGLWKDQESLKLQWKRERVFEPSLPVEERNILLKGWQRAVKATIAWAADQPL